MLTFDSEKHEYRWHGQIVPSVTQVLKHGGQISDFSINDFAAQQGTAVHAACALLAYNRLDLASVDQRILGYVLSYWSFLGSVGWKIDSVEQQRYCEDHRYAGTWDVLFDGHLVDIKTGAPAKWHALQTAAYWRLAGKPVGVRRHSLYLDSNGKTPRLVEHKDRTDLPTFLKLVEDYHGIERNPDEKR